MTDTRPKEQALNGDHDFESVAQAACARLAQNASVRRNLPGEGRLRIDRQLPFLCIYRSPPGVADPGTVELVTTEAAYLFASGEPRYHDGISHVCQAVNATMEEHFGTFLFLEIWSQPDLDDEGAASNLGDPAFEIVTPELSTLPTTIDVFVSALAEISLQGRAATVTTRACQQVAPPGLAPLVHVSPDKRASGGCVLGIAVKPIYRDPNSTTLYPILLQSLRWQLSSALRKAIAQFTGVETGDEVAHYESLGPSSLVKAARIVDQELCEMAESFDFLLQVTPTNAEEAWLKFCDTGYRKTPTLTYRPLPYHPSLLKRRLFDIEIERIEDPTLAHVFWEKQEEIDRQLTALRDLNTPEFLYGSLQLYGQADAALVSLASEILARFPQDGGETSEDDFVSIKDVVTRARDEIDYYRQRLTAFTATVEVCDHIASGIMVSRNRLLISSNLKMRPERVEPLLHHEIGTHLLTYFNGRCQPFQQLYAGLAGYDELQEGLAVLAEYLAGGLNQTRLRNLAGRVMAVDSMTSGASFRKTFQRLHEEYGFAPRQAFMTTLRAHRGGGFTKDVIYLRGLRDLLKYLDSGHDIEPLYVGKIGLQHLPYVQEMRRRGIIDAPSILPRFWDDDDLRERLEACRGLSVLQLWETNR